MALIYYRISKYEPAKCICMLYKTNSKHENSYLAPRLRGINQKKSSLGSAMNNTFLLCYAPEPLSQVTESVLIYGRSLLRTKSRFPAKSVAMTLAFTELRTVSWYQSDNFIVLTLDKAYTLYFLLSYLCKITVFRSSLC